ncbi:patatin-like phospholipase family protein [Luteipulveratus mongoliensis]|uniref:Patatin n=1 Tax=Luteipulveratus mongoliensis TaxID=571913 RepID=A0A0K1JFW2_9MICO|nr:patatin-like phospholipase family protein [Luteipulveratus mongoliensis]AKU15591.1 patatin [Luteipulveratus mongoliensis]
MTPLSTTPSDNSGARALVLGGGGSTGNAWLIGVVAGLLESGLDVTAADLTVGTSAGSTAAAQFSGASPTDLLAATLAVPAPQQGGAARPSRPHRSGPVVDHLERRRKIIASSGDVADMRRRLGAAALVLDEESDGTWQAQWRATVAARLPSRDWPARRVLITAVDARTGEPILLDRDSGVDLADAVAASCASALPYRIADRLYIDGGFRSNAENADLAAGFGRVLVLSPFGGRTLTPREWGMDLATQVDELRANGSSVETVFPDSSAEHLFGTNAMNPSLRAPAAQSGYDQGKAIADPLTAFWR